jgi:dihydroneopterin aldolase
MGDTIRLKNIRLFAVIGDLPHERTMRQPIEIDVEVSTDAKTPGVSDRLSDAVDYRSIHVAVVEATKGDETTAPHLLETLCERVAAKLLEIDRVDRCSVRCRKPWAALDGPVDHVEVEIHRP